MKLSDEDALALSYLTPGLSKRIQQQLLAQLAPSEARKLSRTLSMRNNEENATYNKDLLSRNETGTRRSAERLSSTLPRRFSTDESKTHQLSKLETPKSFLPDKFRVNEEYSPYNDRSSSINECEPDSTKCDSFLLGSYRRSRTPRCTGIREPKIDYKTSRSPDSSVSESVSSLRDDSSSYIKDSSGLSDTSSKRYSSDSLSPVRYSMYNPEYKYLSPTKYYDTPRAYVSSILDSDRSKTELKRPSTPSKRISRFLRPDFYDTPKEENVYLKEKKEREMETQKVLKEIRDKRIKNRINLRRERSASRETSSNNTDVMLNTNKATPVAVSHNLNNNTDREISVVNSNNNLQDTDAILQNVSDNIKKLESNVKEIHDYVNVKGSDPVEQSEPITKPIHDYVNVKGTDPSPVIKKDRISKLIRPKSYPTENMIRDSPALEVVPEKETKSRISRLKKGLSPSKKKETNTEETTDGSSKNRFLQSLEKKITKLRSLSGTPTNDDSEEKKASVEKKSSVENAIKRLREQSLPRNLEQITESGLIKRAVSVEDLTCGGNPTVLQTSRKSVSKILGLFKKYEEHDKKKAEKVKKVKDNQNKANNNNNNDEKSIGANSVIANNQNELDVDKKQKLTKKNDNSNNAIKKNPKPIGNDAEVTVEKKPERPRSLLFDRVRQFQNAYTGARSDSVINGIETKPKTSKLPVNAFRRSLNLENVQLRQNLSPDSTEDSLNNNKSPENVTDECNNKPDRRNLKLDFSKIPSRNRNEPKIIVESIPGTSTAVIPEFDHKENRNSLTTTDDSSVIQSPCDENDVSGDSWSYSSDYHPRDLTSPISPNGYIYSGDEGESVIDRIRRKSFYSRFNEKKKPRKSSYKDLDLYKDISSRKTAYRSPADYGSLDRKYVNYRSASQEPSKADYKLYSRNASLLNNTPASNRYQTYNPRSDNHFSSYYSESEDAKALDDNATGKPKK